MTKYRSHVAIPFLLMSIPFQTQAQIAPSNTESQQVAFRVIELTNKERVQKGLLPLKANESLFRAAKNHSQSMWDKKFFSHVCPLGSQPSGRVKSQGYDYRAVGENIAFGQPTAEVVVQAWMKSPGHRANILQPLFREIGIGYLPRHKNRGPMWTQVFGSRDTKTFALINLEAWQTTNSTVTVYLVTDKPVRRFRFGTDGVNYTDWLPYQAQFRTSLSPGVGWRSIFVELEEATGRKKRIEDSILRVDTNVKRAKS